MTDSHQHPQHPHQPHPHQPHPPEVGADQTEAREEFFPFPQTTQDAIDKQLRRAVAPERIKRTADPHAIVTPHVAVASTVPEPPAAWHGQHTVSVASPAVTPMGDATGVSIPLPSKFFWYPFKDLYVKPLRVAHLAKINAANETGNLQPLAEVVSSVLSTPEGHTNVANMLCVQDWIAVLYHLKLASFNKRGIQLDWTCGDDEHVKAVSFWENMAPKERTAHEAKMGALTDEEKTGLTKWFVSPPPSLQNKAIVDNTLLRTNFLSTAPDPEKYRVHLKGKIPSCSEFALMSPETVLDSIQFMDIDNWVSDHEVQWLAQQAAMLRVLKPNGTPYSLTERIEMIRSEQLEFTSEEFSFLQEFIGVMDTFGVEEFVKVRCKGCGASTVVKSTVDASTFLTKDI
jgi:hypothetical protein